MKPHVDGESLPVKRIALDIADPNSLTASTVKVAGRNDGMTSVCLGPVGATPGTRSTVPLSRIPISV